MITDNFILIYIIGVIIAVVLSTYINVRYKPLIPIKSVWLSWFVVQIDLFIIILLVFGRIRNWRKILNKL
jgi:hypothetical protein